MYIHAIKSTINVSSTTRFLNVQWRGAVAMSGFQLGGWSQADQPAIHHDANSSEEWLVKLISCDLLGFFHECDG